MERDKFSARKKVLKKPVGKKLKELDMLKETMICIIIVIAIIFGNNVTQSYTKESVSELSSELMTLRGELTQDNVENEKLRKQAETIYQQWEKRHDKLAYFIEHDELEKVETEFIALKSYIETEDYEESISELDKSVFILRHIEDKYAFNLQNVF